MEAPAVDNPPKQHQPPRSRTRDPNTKLSRLPMSQDETHELPLPRRIHPTPSPTTQRKRGQHQHASGSDQEILRHPRQRQNPGHVESSERRKDLAFKRHSRRDHTSAKEPVLNNSQRIIRRSGRVLRVPAHLSSLKLDQANPPRRRLRSRPWKNGASQGSGCANKRGKVILNLSPHAEMNPGIASYITVLLFRNGVNILDAFLGYGDIIMVVDDKDGPLAYDVLQREIQGPKLRE